MDTLYYYLRILDYISPFQILVVGITNDYELDQLDDLMMNIWDEHSIKMNILDKHIRWAS